MQEILKTICKYLENNQAIAIATIVGQAGSAPRGAGSKLIADAKGLVAGTVGGGLLEARTLDSCQKALTSGKTEVLDFNLSGELAAKAEMICGGQVQIIIEPLLPSPKLLDFYKNALFLIQNQNIIILAKISNLSSVVREIILASEPIFANFAVNQNKSVEYVAEKYFAELYNPEDRMIIVGGGHVSLSTAQIARIAGFKVIIIDDRPEFSSPERFPWADDLLTIENYENCFARLNPNQNSYIVIVTRGHLHDATVLEQALKTKAGYIGMIGSKRKRNEVYTALLAKGFSQKELDKVHSPIGLEIKAETPAEIGVSIVAQCIQKRRANYA